MKSEDLFWFLMIIWAIFGGVGVRYPDNPFWRGSWHLVTFILFVLIGWKLFGAPLKG